MNEKAHKVMTPEEYAAMPIVGWHSVYRDIDGYGAIGIRFHTDGAALPPLRAREEIALLIEKLRNSDDLNDQQITFACAEAADALSSTAGQEWLAFDPATLSDSELILCLEEMRGRDAAAQTVAEPLLAEKGRGET